MYPFFNYGGFGFPQGQFSQQSPFMGGFNPYQMQGNFGGQQFSNMPNQGGFNQRQFNPPRQPAPTIGNPNIDPSQISGGFRSAIANASNRLPMAEQTVMQRTNTTMPQQTDSGPMSLEQFKQSGMMMPGFGGVSPEEEQQQYQNYLSGPKAPTYGQGQTIPMDAQRAMMGGMGGMAAQRGMQGGAGPQAPTQDAYNNFRAMTGSPISFEEFSQSRGNKLTQQPRFGGQQFGGFQQPQFNPFQQQFSQMSRFQPQQQFGGFQQQFNPYQQQYGGFSQFPQFQNRGLLY
jgi:hypothetical protein